MRDLRRQAWRRWQAAAGSWQGWSVCPTLCAPGLKGVRPRHEERPHAQRLADALAQQMENGRAAAVLDIDPLLGIAVGAALNRRGIANVVLLIARWPYAQAVLPVDGLVDALITESRSLTRDRELPNVVFVLDAERSKNIPSRSASDPRADNRYRLSASDLPPLAALRARGIGRVIKISAR